MMARPIWARLTSLLVCGVSGSGSVPSRKTVPVGERGGASFGTSVGMLGYLNLRQYGTEVGDQQFLNEMIPKHLSREGASPSRSLPRVAIPREEP
ncbi:hypothetical protein, partial [Methanoculleus sp. UBA374]|uniref:hypothetical protein n=1 Tax=Methanoculleus sp. UBA374 TaxID=1915505 RepID=UPI00319E4946